MKSGNKVNLFLSRTSHNKENMSITHSMMLWEDNHLGNLSYMKYFWVHDQELATYFHSSWIPLN